VRSAELSYEFHPSVIRYHVVLLDAAIELGFVHDFIFIAALMIGQNCTFLVKSCSLPCSSKIERP